MVQQQQQQQQQPVAGRNLAHEEWCSLSASTPCLQERDRDIRHNGDYQTQQCLERHLIGLRIHKKLRSRGEETRSGRSDAEGPVSEDLESFRLAYVTASRLHVGKIADLQALFRASPTCLICAEGDLWKDQRRFAAGCLRNLGMVKFGFRRDKMEERILAVVNECLSKLSSRMADGGIDPLETLHHCMGNLMNDLVFGKIYEEDDETWRWLRHLQEEGVKHIGVAGPLNFLPFLRFLPRYGKMMESLIDGKLKSHRFYQTIIDEHRARPNKTDSFLAAFDKEMRNKTDAGDAGYFTRPQFHHLLSDIFGAGVDTTLTTLRWFLLFMAVYPDEQRKVSDELMGHLMGQRQPCLADRTVLIRLEAAISETQRLRSVTPVGIPHGTIQDTQIGDYDVPKGSMVIPLQWAIHTDPSYWHEPLSFKLERFIAQDGSLARPEAFLPFQTGKRMCVGDELARMILFLFAARILHTFVISMPPDTHVDLDGECGITLVPKPHRLLFTARQ
ncbi:Cytochrome P450 306a1 [Harpegnathos saltator]|uniref:Cytochrome P450 306a1 n=1 Tax=Harpegnathos saltator TaxID=610380 RepID=E2B7S0_HARSA|nr:Cytochrome P450 306a1 [Harpegnathos saltator]